MAKVGLSITLKRIQKVRKILKKNPEGLWLRKLANLCGIGATSLHNLLNNFFSRKLESKKLGKMKIIRLIDPTPSEKEKQLLLREKTLKLARKLRKDGLSLSEIRKELNRRIGFSLTDAQLGIHVRDVKMGKEGKKKI